MGLDMSMAVLEDIWLVTAAGDGTAPVEADRRPRDPWTTGSPRAGVRGREAVGGIGHMQMRTDMGAIDLGSATTMSTSAVEQVHRLRPCNRRRGPIHRATTASDMETVSPEFYLESNREFPYGVRRIVYGTMPVVGGLWTIRGQRRTASALWRHLLCRQVHRLDLRLDPRLDPRQGPRHRARPRRCALHPRRGR